MAILPVKVEQLVCEVVEEIRLVRRETSIMDLVYGPLQLRVRLVILFRVIPAKQPHTRELWTNTKEIEQSSPRSYNYISILVDPSSYNTFTHPSSFSLVTSSTVIPKMKILSAPISSCISTLAPSSVPIVRAPLAYTNDKNVKPKSVLFNEHSIETSWKVLQFLPYLP